VEFAENCVEVRVLLGAASLLLQDVSELHHVLDGQGWQAVLDQREAIDILVSEFFGENWGLEEASEPVD